MKKQTIIEELNDPKLNQIKSEIQSYGEMTGLAEEVEANSFHEKGSRNTELSGQYRKTAWEHYDKALELIVQLINSDRDSLAQEVEKMKKIIPPDPNFDVVYYDSSVSPYNEAIDQVLHLIRERGKI